MTATSYATTLRNARLDAITTAIGSAGTCKIYDGTRPSAGGAATTLLATFTMGSPFAPAASGGVLTPTTPSSTTGAATSTATWCRFSTSGGTWVIDADVTGTAGAGPVKLSNTSIASGQTLTWSSCTFTEGNP